jgi:hypothetical protein
VAASCYIDRIRRGLGSLLLPASLDVAAKARMARLDVRIGGGDDGNRTRVRGFADRSLNHSGTSPPVIGWLPREDSNLGSRIQSPLSYH